MSTEADKLRELIENAIADGIVTNEEYHSILRQAGADGREDKEELALLCNLQEMIANGTVQRRAT